jgi:uncharacterized repeat protein (TIGR04138 family)
VNASTPDSSRAVQQRIFLALVALFGLPTENRDMLNPDHPFAELLRRDRRYHRNAYFFVFEALRYAQEQLGLGAAAGDDPESEEERHVTGQQLCEAIRRYAIEQYGLMARSVLNEWGVRSTNDFGEIVFNLIDIGQMKKTHTDRREDFDNVFNFDDGLRDAFQPITSDS